MDFRSAASPLVEDVHRLGVLGRKHDPGSAEVELMGGGLESAACRRGLTGPEVTGVAGMAAAGDQHADACPGADPVGDRVELDADGVSRVGQPPIAVADISGPAPGVDLADPDEHVD